MEEKILEVENLTKVYDGEKAVDGISFFVRAGEIVGLLGPNGAGKTTTISIILGLLLPTSGFVTVFGKDLLRHRSEILSQTNFSAAYAQLPGNLNLWQNLYIFGRLYGVPNLKQKIDEFIKLFNLEKFRNTRSSFLSSGEQSRLSLAKALMNSPRLILLDEPTASIDPSTAKTIRERIRSFAKEKGTGMLMTSHNMYEVEDICDRVIFISHGKILLEGNPRELPKMYGKKNLEDLFITVARESLSFDETKV